MLFTKSLETGVPKIDEQHRELFAQADKLRDVTQKERIPETLEFLKNYVVKHFSMEEALMKASGYPKHPFHHQLHVDFVKQFTGYYDEYKSSGGKFSLVLSINTMVNNWLRDHIMTHDKEFAEYYIQKTSNRARPGVAAQPAGASAAPRTSVFGQKAADAQPRQSVFGQKPAGAGTPQKTSVFGQKPAAGGTQKTSLFGQKPAGTATIQKTSVFGQKPSAGVVPRQSAFSKRPPAVPRQSIFANKGGAQPVKSRPPVAGPRMAAKPAKPSGGFFSRLFGGK
jgi:hemerythrin